MTRTHTPNDGLIDGGQTERPAARLATKALFMLNMAVRTNNNKENIKKEKETAQLQVVSSFLLSRVHFRSRRRRKQEYIYVQDREVVNEQEIDFLALDMRLKERDRKKRRRRRRRREKTALAHATIFFFPAGAQSRQPSIAFALVFPLLLVFFSLSSYFIFFFYFVVHHLRHFGGGRSCRLIVSPTCYTHTCLAYYLVLL